MRVKNFTATGFFRLEEEKERHFLVTPEGHPYYMIGMNTATPYFWNYLHNGFEQVYGGNHRAWGNATIDRMKEWGFNCLTYKTSETLISQMNRGKVTPMPYAPVLKFIENNAMKRDEFPDPWGATFIQHVDSIASELAVNRNNPWIVGYFITNEIDCDLELSWRNRWLKTLLQQDTDSPALRVFRGVVRVLYDTIEQFNQAFGTQYTSYRDIDFWLLWKAFKQGNEKATQLLRFLNASVIRQFYKLTYESIGFYDPNHLILGSRFAGNAEAIVLKAIEEFTDVSSLNKYFPPGQFPDNLINKVYKHAGKPVIHGEFAWLIEGRNVPFPPVSTQKERGEAYEEWLAHAIDIKELIGTCWYGYMDGGWVDETKKDKVMNFGLISIYDVPYEDVIPHVIKANATAMRQFGNSFRLRK